jgi:glycosyltransferase involved in cell wall biosynthesis
MRRAVRRSLGCSDDSLIVSSVGRQAYKNPRAGIECVAELRGRGIDARLLRSGRPLVNADRQYAERLRVMPWIEEQGIVPDSRLVELYNAADVLLQPSFWEGFGWPPLEAMACGTPVVISTAPSLREIVGDAGVAVEATDIRGLVEAVLQVTAPQERDRWRARSLERAAEFSWDSTLRAITQIYDRVRANAEASDRQPRLRVSLSNKWLTDTERKV